MSENLIVDCLYCGEKCVDAGDCVDRQENKEMATDEFAREIDRFSALGE